MSHLTSKCSDASINLPTYLPACRPACLFVCLSVCLSCCMSACVSVFLSVCMTVCLSVCLSENEHLRGKSGPIPQLFNHSMAHRLHVNHILFNLLPKTPVPQSLRPRPQGLGGNLIFSSYVSLGPASTLHPKTNIRNSKHPKKYLKF